MIWIEQCEPRSVVSITVDKETFAGQTFILKSVSLLDKSSGIFLCKMYIVIGVKANDNIWPFQIEERERVGQVIALELIFFWNSTSIEYFEQVHHKIPMDNHNNHSKCIHFT